MPACLKTMKVKHDQVSLCKIFYYQAFVPNR